MPRKRPKTRETYATLALLVAPLLLSATTTPLLVLHAERVLIEPPTSHALPLRDAADAAPALVVVVVMKEGPAPRAAPAT